MHLFVYEFISGGGWYSAATGEPPPTSLATEGRAMLGALVSDLTAAGHRVSALHDRRVPAWELSGGTTPGTGLAPPQLRSSPVSSAAEERREFVRLAAGADWTIVIAPEFQCFLAERCRWVGAAGGKLLGLPVSLVELAADKQRTAEYLAARGIRTPQGCLVEAGDKLPIDWPMPAVIKPNDGAGSSGVRLLASRDEYSNTVLGRVRLEQFCPGLPASVVCLAGPGGRRVLPACEQLLSADGAFRYCGGRLPIAEHLNHRAHRLAEAVLESLPGVFGYLGIDLVLGDDPSGSADTLIEINPRLTTSYIGLRALCHTNLAAALLALAEGREPKLSFGRHALQFRPDGSLGPAGPGPDSQSSTSFRALR